MQQVAALGTGGIVMARGLRSGAARTWGAVALAAGVAFAAPIAVAADGSEVELGGGSLGMSAVSVGDFGAVTLDGSAQTTTATMADFSVTDARGTGGGWNVTVQATQFAEWNGSAYVGGGRTLPANSLTMAAPSVAANGTSSPEPTVPAGPYTLDGGGAVKVASAAVGNGMGTYDIAPGAGSLTLAVPANAYAGTYRSELTVSAVAGP